MTSFYRCMSCGGVVSEWDIQQKGECPKCGHHKIRDTYLTFWEELVQLFKHPVLIKDVWENIKSAFHKREA